MEFEEKITSVETIHEGVVTTYQLAEVTLPDGKSAQREIVRHKSAAAVIAFTEELKIVLVRQYRVAIGKTTLELPAGLREEEDQDGIITAKRELEEETGLRSENWRFVTSFYSTPGFTDEFLEIYEASMNNKKVYLMNPIPDNLLYEEIKGCGVEVINCDLNKLKEEI